ncbi:Hpt domain-containing protein [Bacteriovoracales bacterium]|nr:Hpt domain-containing protein [Bacteriovoracales bacterium]
MAENMNKSSVATKMILTIVFVTLVVASVTSFIILKQDYEKEMRSVDKTMEDAKTSFMKPLATALYAEDEDQVVNALNGILKLPGMVEVRVVNVDEEDEGDAFAAINPETKAKKLSIKKRRSLGPSRVIKIKNVDEDSGDTEHIATMYLYSSLEIAKKKIMAQIINFCIVQLSQVIFLAFAIFLIFRSLVSRHLKNMAAFAQSMDLNDLSGAGLELKRKKSSSNDELQDLTDSFNEMRDNLKKAHAELKDYAENLEDKVKAATKEIEEEKLKVANLLNNMKQAIFSIDSKGIIVGPVSSYSNQVFDGEIEGANVYDALYKDMDATGEAYATLKTSMLSVFGESDLQYDLMEDNFPNRIEFKIDEHVDEVVDSDPEALEKEENIRIFSISYNPMWDSNECLEQLMIVVEDITEKEKLEAEVAHQKKASEKNISIITEMANADLEDISTFLKSSPELVQSTMDLSRIAHENTKVLGEMFRHLHTLKGNARAFNFNSISSLTHIAETIVTQIREEDGKGVSITKEMFLPLIGKLYDINSEINDYGALAKKVFRIENEFENKLISDIQTFTFTFDHLVYKYLTKDEYLFDINQPPELRKKAFDSIVEKKGLKIDEFNNLKRSAHSIKGALRSLNLPDLSEIVHKLENEIVKFDDFSKLELDSFNKEFIVPYLEMKDRIKAIYINSDLNIPYTHETADWINIYLAIFDLSKELIIDNPDQIMLIEEKIEKLLTEAKSLKLNFLTRMSSDLFGLSKMGAEKLKSNEEPIMSIMKEIWIYLLLVSRVNCSRIENKEQKEKIFNLITTLPNDEEKSKVIIEDSNATGSITLSTLRHLIRIGKNPLDLFNEANRFIGVEDSKKLFVIDPVNNTDLKFITADLKTSNMLELPKGTLERAEKRDPLAETLKLSMDQNTGFRFLKLVDFSQLLVGFSIVIEDTDEENIRKINTIPVVMRNYNRLKEIVKSQSDEEITKAFDRLLDVPIIPSLSKYKTMVKDISTKLNKNVDYKVNGGEVTMNKDSFYLLQDAFVHIIRNSLDHGVEGPEERKKKGKSPKGIIQIDCNELDPENIEIKIKDDGKGINSEIIGSKAVEKGIHTSDEINKMSQEDIVKLIFVPSFSQKESVDELSGRGVGMDIVEKNIRKLGGSISIDTEVDKGTTFVLNFKSGS